MAGKPFEKRANVATIKAPETVLPRTAETRQVLFKRSPLFFLLGNATSWKHLWKYLQHLLRTWALYCTSQVNLCLLFHVQSFNVHPLSASQFIEKMMPHLSSVLWFSVVGTTFEAVWIQISALPLISCVMLYKLLNLHVPQFGYL